VITAIRRRRRYLLSPSRMDSRDLSTAERIRSFIEEELLDDPAEPGDPLTNGALDSLAIEQLVTFLWEDFGVTFRDDEVVEKNFSSVARLAELVDEKRGVAGVERA
jgi:acyl carrier protein